MLTTAICSSILCLLAVFSIPRVQAKPVIVDPLPTNLLAIENGKTQVSCSVEDDGGKKPTKIQFVRNTKFGDFNVIHHGEDGNRIQYENKTDKVGKRLTSILHINKVLIKDDSTNGGYECQGFVGSEKDAYGFTVNVIGTKELPGIAVSENRTVKFGDELVLSCNLTTTTPETTRLRKLMWAKDGKIIDEVLHPREESLKSRVIKVTDPSDGGLFSCHLISRLRKSKDYNITDSILITVQPKYFAKDLKDNEIKVFKGDPAKLVCSAKGNPLKTYWKKKLKKDGSVELFDMEGNSTKYDFSYVDKLEDHSLTIKDTEYSDRGFYYCCIQELPQTTNSTKEKDDIEGCQMFTLRVKDPLGALWPVIGIIVEIILLVIIILLAEKFKKRKNQSTKTDGRVEFSYSSTDDNNDKGQVRLRPSAAAASSSETGEKA